MRILILLTMLMIASSASTHEITDNIDNGNRFEFQKTFWQLTLVYHDDMVDISPDWGGAAFSRKGCIRDGIKRMHSSIQKDVTDVIPEGSNLLGFVCELTQRWD